jgi:hypothetical protein
MTRLFLTFERGRRIRPRELCGNLRAKQDAWSFSIGKLDAGRFEGLAYGIHGALLQFVPPLKSDNCVACDLCCSGKVSNAHPKGGSRHSTLHGQKIHYMVPISVAYICCRMIPFSVHRTENE